MDAKTALTVSTCVILLCFLAAEVSSNPALQHIRPVNPYHRLNPTSYHEGYFGNDGYLHYPGYGFTSVFQNFPGHGVPNSGYNGYVGFQNGYGYPGGYSSGYGNGYGYYPPQTGYNKNKK